MGPAPAEIPCQGSKGNFFMMKYRIKPIPFPAQTGIMIILHLRKYLMHTHIASNFYLKIFLVLKFKSRSRRRDRNGEQHGRQDLLRR